MEYNPAIYIPTGPHIAYWQNRWARARGIKRYGGYTQTVEENLFQPLTEASRAELRLGAENEMGKEIRSLYSSSAFVCNIFDYWRDRPLEPLAAALDAPVSADYFHFDITYPIGLRDIPPHLDVVFGSNELKPFLIEANFTEPYRYPGTTLAEDTFTKSYFPDSGEIWGRYGLARCEALARRIHAEQEEFSVLDARQLLTRILGLAKVYGKGFTLLYLWYDDPSQDAARHRAQIKTFMLRLNGEIDFRAMTYQELFQKIKSNPSVDTAYVEYLAKRYFRLKANTKSS